MRGQQVTQALTSQQAVISSVVIKKSQRWQRWLPKGEQHTVLQQL
jgi:hypothetical protein